MDASQTASASSLPCDKCKKLVPDSTIAGCFARTNEQTQTAAGSTLNKKRKQWRLAKQQLQQQQEHQPVAQQREGSSVEGEGVDNV